MEPTLSIDELMALVGKRIADQQPQAAVQLYLQWLQDHPDSPLGYLVCFNLGILYAGLGNVEAATVAYRLSLQAGCIEAGVNLGLLAEQQGHVLAAVDIWQTLVASFWTDNESRQVSCCPALNHLGRVLTSLGRLTEAESAFGQSLDLLPDQSAIRNHRLYLRQWMCLWPVTDQSDHLEHLVATDSDQMQAYLALIDDPHRQSSVWTQYLRFTTRPDTTILHHGQPHAHERVRLAYLLSDLQSTAGSWLYTLVEYHDADRYQPYIFLRSHDNPELPAWVSGSDCMVLTGASDYEVARAICAHAIDWLIDLDGYHQGVLDYRPSPLQFACPGLACYVDHAAVDYILADPFVWQHLPDAKRLPLPVGGLGAVLTHEERSTVIAESLECQAYGSADTGPVYGYSGDAFRITETLFTRWIQILERVPGSTLWLDITPVEAHANVLAVASRLGLAPGRLVLIPHTETFRYDRVHLFLDTYPASTCTGCHEALRWGVPVLSCIGDAPASRWTGSFLNALGLPELMVANLDDYLQTAVDIGLDADRLALIRAYLQGRIRQTRLFNPLHWVRGIEALYEQAHAKQQGAFVTPRFPEKSGQNDPKPFFSVVVVHYEGSVSRQEAVRCLQSLYHQKYHNFEILFLHDGPRTQPWETDEFPPPRWIRLKTHATPVRANDYGHSLRDLGIRMARGQYLLITNADNYHYTCMLLEVYLEIMRPYPRVVIHDIDRTAADIIIFGVLAKGYMSLGTHENLIDFREFNMDMAARQWMYLSGYPSIMKNIDCMQFVMRRELWLREGGWHIKQAQASDGLLFQDFVKKYGVRYVVGPLAEHL